MGEFAIGQPVPRFEDPRLVKGGGRYVADMVFPGMAFGYVLRSPHAHARIRSIDTSKAKAAPGVLAVLTGADYKAAGFGDLPVPGGLKRRDGAPGYRPRYPALVEDKVRMIGDYVAFVVAETYYQAVDASELIEIDYEPLPALVSTGDAVKPGVPQVWDDCPNNIGFVQIEGNKEATDTAFARAAHVVKGEFVINRVTAATMEPRGCIGLFEPIEGRYTIYTTLQRTHVFQTELSNYVLKVPDSKIRVVCGDIGGSFGMKSAVYNEVALVLLGAKVTGRPVKWVATRSESFSVRCAGARQRHPRRACARQGRHLPGIPRQDLCRHRRLPPGRHAGIHRQSRHARRRLPHTRFARRRDGGVHPHPAGAPLSRQWPTGSGLRHRAHGRSCRRPDRHRPGGTAPAQHDCARAPCRSRPA